MCPSVQSHPRVVETLIPFALRSSVIALEERPGPRASCFPALHEVPLSSLACFAELFFRPNSSMLHLPVLPPGQEGVMSVYPSSALGHNPSPIENMLH
jgi:hypothetical protein